MPLHPSVLAELPEQLKGYKLLERLGRGGFGEVWKVEAPGGFLKAMKFVFGNLEDIDEDGQPAEQELKALHRVKSIRHPYILSLERFDVIEGQLIIVMELAEKTLWDRFRECRLAGKVGIPRDELLSLLTEAAEALDLMNNHYQIQHLDVKPQNLFLVFDHIKVADFGLAKAFEGARATITGGVTPVYAAPETFEGYVSRYSDQYSLAIVFQELLTGCRPFNGANTKQLLLQHLRESPDLTALPPADRPIIGRALSKTPNERWPTCKEMLKRLAGGGTDTPLPPDLGALPLPADSPTVQPTRPKADAAPGGATMPAADLMRARSDATASPTRPAFPALRGPSPPLVTPRLVTPKSAGGSAPALTLTRQQVAETGRMGKMGIAPPEKTGDGVLFPALVVGVGQRGLAVVRRLRRLIADRFGTPDALPTLKFLFIDTDAETVEAAGQGDVPLSAGEVFHAKLNRPAHYLQRDGLPPVDGWLPPGLLYQLPKTPTSAGGVRAFGRLALCDHYRPLVQRVRQVIEGFMAGDVVGKAAADTGLGVRTNQPRVYVAAGLGGGTGGGMFQDLAYLLKHEFRQVGYKSPEAVGVLLMPAADKRTPRAALANTFAALAEVYHFASGERFQTRYDTADAAVVETRPAFDRTAVVELPKSQKPADEDRTVGGLARLLYLDLVTPVGRAADYIRAVAPVDKYAGPVAQPVGLYRLSWPRVELLAAISRRFCQQLLQRWTEKEAAHLREPIQSWLADQWARLDLDPARLIARLEAAVAEQLRETPEAVFDAAVDALRTNTPASGKLGAQSAVAVLEQVLKLIGKPTVEASGEPGTMVGQIDTAAKHAMTVAEAHLASVAVSFIEQPQYRLAGAEEALAQVTARLTDTVEKLEVERRRLTRDETDAYARMFPLIGGLNATGFSALGTRRSTLLSELFDLMAAYPKKRYRLLLVLAAQTVYRGLLSAIPDCLRDVNHCRASLDGISAGYAAEPTAGPDAEPGAFVLPVGCATLDAAADQFLAALAPDELLQFDHQLQAAVVRKFGGLAPVCIKQKRADRFQALLRAAAREYLDARLDHADPVAALTRFRGNSTDGLQVLADAFDAAKPPVAVSGSPMEATLLASPAGPAGELIRQMAAEANPGTEFIPAELADDLVLIREYPRLPLVDLPQLGPVAREAYHGQAATGVSPHARADAQWLSPVRTGSG